MIRTKLRTPVVATGGRFLVASAAVITLLGSATSAATASSAPQSSGARFAAEASQYQNSTIARAMDRVSGGTRITAGEVEWAHGGVILMVPTSSNALAATCPGNYVCVWTATGYSGGELQIDDNPAVQKFIHVGLALNAEESVMNRTGYRYWMEQYQNHGNELCLSPDQNVSAVNSANDHDGWGLVTLNGNNC